MTVIDFIALFFLFIIEKWEQAFLITNLSVVMKKKKEIRATLVFTFDAQIVEPSYRRCKFKLKKKGEKMKHPFEENQPREAAE